MTTPTAIRTASIALASAAALTACAAPASEVAADPISLPCTTVSLDASPSEVDWLSSKLKSSGRAVTVAPNPHAATLRVTIFPVPLWPATQRAGFISQTVEVFGQRSEVAARLASIAPPCTTPEKEKSR